jgi:hypothetical protein
MTKLLQIIIKKKNDKIVFTINEFNKLILDIFSIFLCRDLSNIVIEYIGNIFECHKLIKDFGSESASHFFIFKKDNELLCSKYCECEHCIQDNRTVSFSKPYRRIAKDSSIASLNPIEINCLLYTFYIQMDYGVSKCKYYENMIYIFPLDIHKNISILNVLSIPSKESYIDISSCLSHFPKLIANKKNITTIIDICVCEIMIVLDKSDEKRLFIFENNKNMTYIKSLSFREKIKKIELYDNFYVIFDDIIRIYNIIGKFFKYIYEIWLSDIEETTYFIGAHEMDNKLFILKDGLRLAIFDLNSYHIIYNDKSNAFTHPDPDLSVMKCGFYKPLNYDVFIHEDRLFYRWRYDDEAGII